MSTLYIIRGKPRFQVFLDRVRCQQVSTVLGSVAQSMLNYAFICEEEVWPELIETFLGDASFGSTYFISRWNGFIFILLVRDCSGVQFLAGVN